MARNWTEHFIITEQELERVHKSKTDYYKVEKMLRSRMRNKRKEYFVKWLRYPEKFNSWVPAEHVKDVKKYMYLRRTTCVHLCFDLQHVNTSFISSCQAIVLCPIFLTIP